MQYRICIDELLLQGKIAFTAFSTTIQLVFYGWAASQKAFIKNFRAMISG